MRKNQYQKMPQIQFMNELVDDPNGDIIISQIEYLNLSIEDVEYIDTNPKVYKITFQKKGKPIHLQGTLEEIRKRITTIPKYDDLLFFQSMKVQKFRDAISMTYIYKVDVIDLHGDLHVYEGEAGDIIARMTKEGIIAPQNPKAKQEINRFLNLTVESSESRNPPGFFLIDDQIVASDYQVPKKEDIDPQELNEALGIMEKLVEAFPDHTQEKVIAAIKWSLTAPFQFITRQKNSREHSQALALIGETMTGKTTIARIAASIWGESPRRTTFRESTGFDTPARMGKVLSETTFPIIIDEIEDLLERSTLRTILKNALTGERSRSKYDSNSQWTEQPAYASLILTGNREIPHNDNALITRLRIYHFTHEDSLMNKKPEERLKFTETLEEALKKHLPKIGEAAASILLEKGEFWNIPPRTLQNDIIKEIYKLANRRKPPWLLKWGEEITFETHESDIIDLVRAHTKKYINKRLRIPVREEDPHYGIRDHVEDLLNTKSVKEAYREYLSSLNCEWSHIPRRSISNEFRITKAFMELVLPQDWKYSFSETMQKIGAKYKVKKIGGKSMRVGVFESIDDFLEFLFPEEGEGGLEKGEDSQTRIKPKLRIG